MTGEQCQQSLLKEASAKEDHPGRKFGNESSKGLRWEKGKMDVTGHGLANFMEKAR